MKNRSKLIWIIPLILGILFDILFWKQIPGVNFSIFVVLCLLGGFLFLHQQEVKPSVRSWLLIVLILFFASVTFLRQEPLTVFLGVFFTLFLLAELAFTYQGGQWLLFGIIDHVIAFFRLAGGMIARPFNFLTSRNPNGEAANRKNTKIWAIVRGVLLAIPVLLIFASLLSSADLIFAQKVTSFVDLFRLEKLPEYIFRTAYILFGAYLLMGVFLHAAASSQAGEGIQGEKKPLIPPFLGFIETGIILGSVVILFSLFVIVQFRYFFGGAANIHLEGYTYAEYARKGFGELVVVAVISLFLLLGLSGVSLREKLSQQKVFSGLGIALVLLVGVMMVSAYQRLVLYETAYGFSELRTYTHVFMIWLGALLVAVMILELANRERKFALAVLLAAIGFAASLPLLNVDAFIVRQNVDRATQGQDLDVAYLASLGFDAVPELAAQYNDPDLSPGLHHMLGASLLCKSELTPSNDVYSWRSFHYSRSKAEKIFSDLEGDFNDYDLEKEDYQINITTPSGQVIECRDLGGVD
ncbi:MAG TPA: DUF4173 domain-containing protein [Anaerolineales bacterium]|nr:DUF4173 domain-containing protein [Anaerolineales bacterium]